MAVRESRMGISAVFSLTFFSLLTSLAAADSFKSLPMNDSTSPASVLYCSGGHWPGGKKFLAGVDFASKRTTLKAVEIRFDLYDAFGTFIAGINVQDAGSFAPGVRIRHSSAVDEYGNGKNYSFRDRWPDAKVIECSIARTLDESGEVWESKLLSTPPPSPIPD